MDNRERPQGSGHWVGVAHPVSSHDPQVGGAETHVVELARELAEDGGQVLTDFRVAAGKVMTIPNGTWGPVMTVTYEPPRLNWIGSPHALTLTHQEGSSADVGSFQAAYGNLICDAP